MDGGQGLKVVLPVVTAGHPAVVILSGGRIVADDLGEFGFERGSRGSFVQKKVGLEAVIEPMGVSDAVFIGVQRPQHIEMEVGVGREVGHHSRNTEIPSADVQDPVQGLLPMEVFLGRGLGDHHGVGLFESCFRISGCKGKGEHFEKIGIGRTHPVFIEHHVLVFDGDSLEGFLEADGALHFGVVFEQGRREDGRGVRLPDLGVADHGAHRHALDAAGIFVKPVVAPLVAHKKQDQNSAGHAQRQTEYVDE